MKVVIVGGVAGGASAAARLRRLDEQAEIILFERGEYISYANCGLPYYIGGEITDRSRLTLQTPKSFQDRFAIDVRVQNEVIAINPQQKTVTIVDLKTNKQYEERYDKLILSPGAEPFVPPLAGVDDDRVFILRTIPDTYKIHDFVKQQKPKHATIVGGGFIGLEMAENLKHLGMEVTVIEAMEHVMASLDYDMACEVHRYLRHKGVHLHLKKMVKAFEAGDKQELLVRLDNGDTITTDMVLLSAGVRPESALAKQAGLTINERGAIITDVHMRTSNQDIYAVGDAVEVMHFVTRKPTYIPLAGPANKQGRIAADHICGIKSVYKGSQGSAILKLFDMTVASTGLSEKAAQQQGIAYEVLHTYSPSHATYYPGASDMSIKTIYNPQTGRILGAQIVGFDGVDKRCDVMATAIRAGMTAYDLTELELCYAPPFSSAKDPVNMAGYAIENILTGKVKSFQWYQVESILSDKDSLLLDVRTQGEYDGVGRIKGTAHIPLNQLREKLSTLDRSKKLYVYCQSGLRSYIACRILSQNGWDCYNLSGGYRHYQVVTEESEYDSSLRHACGMKVE